MQCPSVPISPRNAAVCDVTGSAPVWRLLSAAGSSNDVERRAGPVSAFSDAPGPRSPAAPSSRLRPRVPTRSSQQRPAYRRSLGAERQSPEPLRLRDIKAGWQGGRAQQGSALPAGSAAVACGPRGLRRRDHGAAGGGAGKLSGAESGAGTIAAAGAPPRRTGIVARLTLALIRGYQRSISPSLGNVCRYQPSCSHYAHEAIERHGVIRGVLLAARRLARCRPLAAGGYDPVPD